MSLKKAKYTNGKDERMKIQVKSNKEFGECELIVEIIEELPTKWIVQKGKKFYKFGYKQKQLDKEKWKSNFEKREERLKEDEFGESNIRQRKL